MQMAIQGDYNSKTIQTSNNSRISLKNEHENLHWRYEEHLSSDPDTCSRIVCELLARLESSTWGNRDTFGIHMAMEEAVLNAIRHGNKSDPSKTFHVVIEITTEVFYSRITDQGEGFDPESIPDPTLCCPRTPPR